MRFLAAAAIALVSAGLAVVAVYVTLGVFYLTTNEKSFGQAARWVLAGGSTTVSIILALLICVVFPPLIAARLGLPHRFVVVIGGLIFGLGLYGLLLYASIVNSCAVDTAFPFSFVGECGD